MNILNNLLNKIKNKKGSIIWHQNNYYNSKDLTLNINKWRKLIRKNRIRTPELIGFQDAYNLNSISFFLAALLEKLIVVNLPEKQKKLINIVPCNYHVDTKRFRIEKKKQN